MVVFDGGVEMRCLKKEVNPDTVAVVVTGHPDVLSELAREAIEEDAYALLRKPSNTDGVPALLREASKE